MTAYKITRFQPHLKSKSESGAATNFTNPKRGKVDRNSDRRNVGNFEEPRCSKATENYRQIWRLKGTEKCAWLFETYIANKKTANESTDSQSETNDAQGKTESGYL